jgi:hypothetical protein
MLTLQGDFPEYEPPEMQQDDDGSPSAGNGEPDFVVNGNNDLQQFIRGLSAAQQVRGIPEEPVSSVDMYLVSP